MEQLKKGYSIQTFSGNYGEIIEIKVRSVVIQLEDYEKFEIANEDIKQIVFRD